MAKSKSSKQWLKEHFKDEFVQKARQDGYRSRATYKLIEIQGRNQLIKPGQVVVDLGAAPGGWSQYAVELVGKQGAVVGLDILPMAPLEDVAFIEGDFREAATLEKLMQTIAPYHGIDWVLSDIAPNMSGIKAVDQPKSMYLVELAYDFAINYLKPNGGFLCKVFQGTGFDELLRQARQDFDNVAIRKPKASRTRSIETYLLARGFRANNR
ncbi:23S rRNA (uridine(2552)-2'-O)-methyltransferase RlmE [Ostreibacterium oceani]|uniref:Ribosomal RNA large subunit methyltransferase E n=1 Tax=Ostreibacterium oceani TaxID=2654998 RepID=A0A6N7EXJ0_9GAMM|nr:23S rRNA (uridine(2552)-2'-O)-methyltransferase RlmE [Ostreibacterium oceani]MPV86305.1 23S rRNA (uridine(2552)-2'-O)-methyltransferase RlmE [Ostreibacterium oceani]